MNSEIMELGYLNTSLYNCITPQIDTDRVIITNKQLDHIADNHPDAYEEALVELRSVLADPDYIFRDNNHNNTGLVVKMVRKDNAYLYIILKVCTDSNGGELANSVTSAWKISEKRLKNYIKNKTILYKKT